MNGFHFSQRQGSLNLKSLMNVNLDRVIRETDVDTLQMHLEKITFSQLREQDIQRMSDPDVVKLFKISQLMLEYLLYSQDRLAGDLRALSSRYASKKKDLMRKRKEIMELNEAARHLKSDLTTKRRNISSLEDMLKKATRTHTDEATSSSSTSDDAADKPSLSSSSSSSASKSSPVKNFFVTCPDGLSIEYNFRASMAIFELKGELRKFIADRLPSVAERGADDLGPIKLVYQGRILADHLSLGEAGIRNGDSVVALVQSTDRRDEGPSSSTPATVTKDDGSITSEAATAAGAVAAPAAAVPELVEILNRQQDMMAILSDALKRKENEANTPEQVTERERLDKELLIKLDDRWASMEVAMRSQMDSQLAHYQQLLKEREDRNAAANALMAGDIESDDDGAEQRMREERAIKELRGQLQAYESRINNLEAAVNAGSERERSLFETIEGQKGELKLLRQQQTASLSAGSTSAVTSGTNNNKKKAAKRKSAKDGSKDATTASKAAPAREKTSPEEGEGEGSPTETGAPVMALPQPVDETVTIHFPLNLSPDLKEYVDKFVSVTVKRGLDIPDLIYVIRKQISELTDVPIARVVIRLGRLHNVAIETTADVESTGLQLSVSTAVSLASEGDLTVGIKHDAHMTSEKIEGLVKEWDKDQGGEGQEEGGADTSPAPKASVDTTVQKQERDAISPQEASSGGGGGNVQESVESLKAALTEVAGSRGLSSSDYVSKTVKLSMLDADLRASREEAPAADEAPVATTSDSPPLLSSSANTGSEVELEAPEPSARLQSPGPSSPLRQDNTANSSLQDIPELGASAILDTSLLATAEEEGDEQAEIALSPRPEDSETRAEAGRGSMAKEEAPPRSLPDSLDGGRPLEASDLSAAEETHVSVDVAASGETKLSEKSERSKLRESEESNILIDSFNDSISSRDFTSTAAEVLSRADELENIARSSAEKEADDSFEMPKATTIDATTPSQPTAMKSAPGSADSKASSTTASPFGMMSIGGRDNSALADAMEGRQLALEGDRDASESLALSDSHESL